MPPARIGLFAKPSPAVYTNNTIIVVSPAPIDSEYGGSSAKMQSLMLNVVGLLIGISALIIAVLQLMKMHKVLKGECKRRRNAQEPATPMAPEPGHVEPPSREDV